MLGAAFPLEPVLGHVLKGFAYNGRSWVKTRGAEWQNVQVFTTSGQYVPSPDLLYVIVECIGAGGGGGWAARGTGVLSGNAGAGGGGSGGYSRKTLPAEFVIQGADVIIAAGGLVGFNATGWQYALDTTFGDLCIAKGGQNAMPYDGLGVTGVVPSFGQPGLGAPVGTGDVAMPGAGGEFWRTLTSWQTSDTAVYLAGGMGGQIFGGNTYPVASWNPNSNVNGTNGVPNSGAGGSGGITGSNTTALGGAGGSGLVIVTEICGTENGGGPGPEPPVPPGWPPGVPFNVNLRAKVVQVPYVPPEPEPVK